jgi:ADP-ribosyltransferase exoenzyme
VLNFTSYLTETLADEVKKEPRSNAAKDAKRLGLRYMGFGRYADRKGKITFLVHNNKLVPFKSRDELYGMESQAYDVEDDAYGMNDPLKKKATLQKAQELQRKTNELGKVLNQRERIDRNVLDKKHDQVEKTHRQLKAFYQSQVFSDNELQAIRGYTADMHNPINQYLYKGFDEGTTGTDAAKVKAAIADLDSAFDQTEIPFDYSTYTGLSSRYKPENFKVGGTYVFRGYVSTSLDHDIAVTEFSGGQADKRKGKKGGGGEVRVVLQIDLKKGQRGIYLDGEAKGDHKNNKEGKFQSFEVSSTGGEKETLLPRGSHIKVISGPHHIDINALSPGDSDPGDSQIVLFHCEVIDE